MADAKRPPTEAARKNGGSHGGACSLYPWEEGDTEGPDLYFNMLPQDRLENGVERATMDSEKM